MYVYTGMCAELLRYLCMFTEVATRVGACSLVPRLSFVGPGNEAKVHAACTECHAICASCNIFMIKHISLPIPPSKFLFVSSECNIC